MEARSTTSWSGALLLLKGARALVAPLQDAVEKLRQSWNRRLEYLGGDPSSQDWTRFRPLRLGREEDWSDWLAHLVETSRTGAFMRKFLGDALQSEADLSGPRLPQTREICTSMGWRCDLVFEWPGVGVHVEVKIHDPKLKKTIDTARAVQADRPNVSTHVLLLSDELVPDWNAIVKGSHDELAQRIVVRTWTDVAGALRLCLLGGEDGRGESLAWQAWALALCGAVEQKILGLPRLGAKLNASAQAAITLDSYSNLMGVIDG